jgi:hypothetical protein
MAGASRWYRQAIGPDWLAVLEVERDLDLRVHIVGVEQAHGLVAEQRRSFAGAGIGYVTFGNRPGLATYHAWLLLV